MDENKKDNFEEKNDEKTHNLSSFDKEEKKDLSKVAKKRNVVYYTLMVIFLILAIVGITVLVLKRCNK